MTTAVGTSIDVAKAQLVALLEATFAGDDDPVSVIYGPRTTETVVEDRLVSVQGISGVNESDSLSGDGGSFTERYRITVVCSVDLPGAGDEQQQVVTEAAIALWRRARAAVRTAPGRALSAPAAAAGIQKAVAGPEFDVQEKADSTSRAAAVRWSVEVIAQSTT